MTKAKTLADTVSTGGPLATPGAVNLPGGAQGSVPYQSAAGVTALLAPGTAGHVLTSGGSGANPSWAPAVTAPAGSTGQVQINNAGAFGAIASGTTGQVLTSAGAGAAPTWTTPSAGALTLIATQTPSAQADPTFTTGISSTYKVYKLQIQIYASDGANFTPYIRVYANGAVDTNGAYAARYFNGSTYSSTGTTTQAILTATSSGSSISNAFTFEVTIYANWSQSSPYTLSIYSSGVMAYGMGIIQAGGVYDGTLGRNGTITGIQVMTNGQSVNGRVSLYGVSS